MCSICQHRPPAKDSRYCTNCQAKLDAQKAQRRGAKPAKFATYRGHVVGFYRRGDGMLVPSLLRRKPEGLPKGKTLDLNTYIEGFTREQVKHLKNAILTLANS